MKILIVSTIDISGGAARAAYRLHKALLRKNIDSQMLVQNKKSDDFTVVGPSSKFEMAVNLARPTLDTIPVMFYRKRTKKLFEPALLSFSSMVEKINQIDPDIVHLHWVNGGMLKIEDLKKIKVPIVWSLHDMWTFTGGCHYDEGCGAYKEHCGTCKVLGSTKENDLSRKVFYRKQRTFSKIPNMTIVGLSQWLTKCSSESMLLKDKKHINLPNPIDAKIFKPFDKKKARELWNLPQDKLLVLFGSMSATSDANKGFEKLRQALLKLDNIDVEFVVFGCSTPKESQNFGVKTHYLGYIYDDVSIVTLYSAADVMIVPSLQENLSNVIMESLACATPVVAFNIGGNCDMIEHMRNGYLAKPFDTIDLSDGIKWVLRDSKYEELCKYARDKVLREFDSDVVTSKYISLYQEILDAKK